MCMICERIRAIKNGTNPYFVQELETGYVVLGDHQHFKGYTLFLCKQHAAESLWPFLPLCGGCAIPVFRRAQPPAEACRAPGIIFVLSQASRLRLRLA